MFNNPAASSSSSSSSSSYAAANVSAYEKDREAGRFGLARGGEGGSAYSSSTAPRGRMVGLGSGLGLDAPGSPQRLGRTLQHEREQQERERGEEEEGEDWDEIGPGEMPVPPNLRRQQQQQQQQPKKSFGPAFTSKMHPAAADPTPADETALMAAERIRQTYRNLRDR